MVNTKLIVTYAGVALVFIGVALGLSSLRTGYSPLTAPVGHIAYAYAFVGIATLSVGVLAALFGGFFMKERIEERGKIATEIPA